MNQQKDAGPGDSEIDSLRQRIGQLEADNEELRRSQEALRESQERFRHVFEEGPVGIVLVGPGRRIMRANATFCRMVGYVEGELVGLDIWDITYPQDRGLEVELGGKVSRGEIPSYQIEKRYVGKAGQVVWATLTSTVIRDGQGQPRYSLSVVEDISERKRMEEALRLSAAQYRAIVEDQTELICRFRPDAIITFVNEAYCRCFGRTREQLVGQSFLPLIPEPNRTETRLRIASLSAANPTITNEHRVTTGSGEIRWQQWTNRAIFDEQGRIVEYQATGRDITERKRVEEALRQSEATAKALLNATADRVLLLDERDVILDLNERAAASLGLSAADAVGRRLNDLMPPDAAGRRRNLLRQVISTGQPETLIDHRDGRILEGRAYPIFDVPGKVTRLAVYVRDITEQTAAEEALRESEERFRTIFQDSPVGMVLVDGDMRIVRPNKALCRMLGYQAEELTGLTILDITDARDRQASVEFARQVLTGRVATRQLEKRYLGKDGRVIRGLLTAALMRDQQARRLYALAIIEDITQRKMAEEALQESEEKYRALVEGAGETIFMISPEGTFLFMNGTGAQRLGGRPEDYVDKTMWDVFPPDVANRQMEIVGQVVRSGQGVVVESRTQVRGQPRWHRTSVQPLKDGAGRTSAVLGIAADITERKEAEQALLATQNRLQHMLATSPAIIYTCQPSRDYPATYMSENVRVQLGYEPEEFLSKPSFWAERLHPEDRPRVLAALAEVHETDSCAVEYRFRHKDGEYRWMRDEVRLVRQRHGRTVEMVGCWFDVSRRKGAEESLRALHRKLMTAREQERRALAGELHDSIGQGLVALHLGLRGILDGLKEPAAAESVARLDKQCDLLVHEVRHICHGLYPPTLESLGLVAALRQLGRDFGQDRQIKVRCAPAAGRFPAEIEIALFRIAQEAVANAVRHGHARHINLTLSCAGGEAALSVSDDGAGFDAGAAMAKGLGLSTMEERAQAVGGRLKIASRPGKTSISVRVPVGAEVSKREQSRRDSKAEASALETSVEPPTAPGAPGPPKRPRPRPAPSRKGRRRRRTAG